MNRKQNPRKKESNFCTTRRALLFAVATCLAVVPFLYYRSESTKNEPVIIKPIPFASTVPALDLDLKNRDVFTQAPETRSLQGVDDTTGEVTDASFLADLLPLKILRILPSTESVNRDSSSNIELYGRTALLVVFNRAVIPLGGDWEQYSEDLSKAPFVLEGLPAIPGKFRWVTTSIARFDPDVDWPTDLEFTLKIKKGIKSYDGTPLSITKDSIFEQKYETPSLSMHISHVDSPKTRNLTNGLWSSRSEGELHEVPPDAKITLHFSHSINHDLVTQALQVYGKDSQRVVEFETTKCSDTCIFLTLKTKLDVDTTYTIHLPKGSQYHSYAGKLREAISEDFTGLVSFKFPFNGLHAAANRYHLWLRHGLDPSVTMEQFQQAITIYENDNKLPSSAWTVDRPHAGVLRITGTFKPVTSYKISVQKSSDILDGYGLSLQQAETSFKTVELPNYVSSPLGTLFENDFASDWEFLVRGHQQDCNGVILENINKNNIMKVLKDYYYYYYDYEEGTYGKTHPNYKSFPTDSKNTIVNFDNAVFGKSGSVYSRRACRWASKEIITKTDMAVVLTDESDTLIAWVTSMSTGLPIEGATVELYDAYTRDKQVKKISSNQTGDDGMALLATPSGNGQPLVVVSVGDSLLILRNVPSGYSSDRHPRYQASMFSDRSIYRLGETVHLKGYVNKYEMQTFSNVPDANLQNATISVSWDRNSHVSVTAKIDPELGSFNASLEIPYNALYAVTNINLQIQAPDHSSVYHSISVTIADPRLPTSTLDLQIEESTFKPQLNEIPITVETKSYTGNPIPDAEVTLRWNVNRYFQFTRHSPWEWWSRIRPWYTNFGSQEIFGVGLMPSGEQQVTVQPEEEDASTQKDQGTLLIKTDASGKVDHKFTLPAELLNRPVSDEDTINFEVEWIGPTREKLTQSVSKRVAHSDWKIGVQLPTEEVIPGYPFDVFVRLLDASKVDAIVEGQQVQLALYEWDGKTPLTRDLTNGAASLPFSVVGECEITSSSESLTNCSFTLPEARQYVLLTTTIDPSSYSVVTAVPVGKSPEDWKHSPLGHLPVSHMIWADKETYQIGDTAKVSFYVPYDGRVLVFWGNQLATQSMQQAVQTGKATIDIPVGKECYPDGCSVDIILSVPRDPNASLPLDVPASPLLDLGLPKEVRFSKVLNVYQHLPQVHVDVKPESDVARPGSTAQIEVSLTSEDNQPVSGEVTLWLVDKSIYDLQPSPPPNCTAQFMQSFKSKYRQITTSVETLSSEKALRNARQILLRRMGIDHWIIPSWDLQSPSELETSDEEFFVKHFGQLTKFPGYGYFHHRMFSRGHDAGVTMHSFGSAESVEMAPTLYSKKSVDTSSILLLDIAEPPQEQGPVIRSSTKFIMTPVFLASVKVDSTGHVKLPINLPDNIGTFKVFATAVSVDKQNDTATLRYGTGESELISRQPLSLQPSVPRITRLGDKFQAGVTVTITEPESDISQVKVTAQMKQGAESFIQLNNEATKTVSIKQTQPVEIVFDFEALRLGDALIQFTAELISENSKYSDGVEVTIPVLGLQEPVLVATSFSLDGKPATVTSSQEGIKLPNAVPGSGNVTLEAGVGRLPSIMLLSEGIFNLVHHYETGSTLLSALAPKAALEAYNDGLEQHTRENLASEHLKAIATIAHYTSSDLGLTYFSPRNDDYPRYPSTYLNGIGLLQAKLMQKISDVVIPAELTGMWSSAFQAALRDEINRYGTTSMYWVSIFNYVYGPNAQLAGIEDKKNVVSFDNLVKNLDHHSCDASCKSIVALTIMDNSMSSQTQLLNNIIAYLESSIRVQGRTAYLTYNVGSGTAGSAGMMSNALGLWALSTYNYQTKASLNVLIEKVANYLGANSATRGFHATDSAFVALSLCNYDMLKGSTTPNVKLTVSSGQNVLLNEIFDSPSDPIVKKKHSWDILSDTVDFDAIGQGEVSIAIGLSFIPNDLFNTTIYRGIYVEKTIQLIDPFTHEAIGKHLTEVPTGTTVKVTIQLTTPDDLSNVVLIDPVPAGLEPIDPNISPAAGMGYQFGSYSGYACWDCWWFPWYSFPKQETMKDQVKFISSSLGAGTHTVSYEALAVTSGTFTLPPAKAFVLNQPELMGLSAAGKFIVKERL